MARPAYSLLADLVATVTTIAAVGETVYWWTREYPELPAKAVQFVYCVILLGATFLCAIGWLLQRKGPLWSRLVGVGLLGSASSLVVLWTAFFLADVLR